jgi:hypothetical protein
MVPSVALAKEGRTGIISAPPTHAARATEGRPSTPGCGGRLSTAVDALPLAGLPARLQLMYYTYVLESTKTPGTRYIGHTSNLPHRLARHNVFLAALVVVSAIFVSDAFLHHEANRFQCTNIL